jgi:hypothetical protein
MKYLTALWHLLSSEHIDSGFWQSFKDSCSTNNEMKDKPRVFAEKDKITAMLKEGMTKALIYELDRLQEYWLDDRFSIVEKSIRLTRLNTDENDAAALSRMMHDFKLKDGCTQVSLKSGKSVRVDLLEGSQAYSILQPVKHK